MMSEEAKDKSDVCGDRFEERRGAEQSKGVKEGRMEGGRERRKSERAAWKDEDWNEEREGVWRKKGEGKMEESRVDMNCMPIFYPPSQQ